MRTQVKYSEVYKQVTGMIIIPLLYTGVFILIMSLIDQLELPETLMNILIYAGSFFLIVLSVLTILKYILVDAYMEYDGKGIHVHLEKNSFLFPHNDFFISYSNIENASISQDRAGRTFATIRMRSPSRSIILSPGKENSTTAFESCWEGMEQQFRSFNTQHSDHPLLVIRNKGFYEGKWIKLAALLSFLLAIVFSILKIIDPSSVSTWKLIAFYCFALPFITIVFRSNQKKQIHS